MPYLRSFLAVVLSISLAAYAVSPGRAAPSPIGILTQANHAHVDEAVAFPGISVFEGEHLSTEAEGRLGVRVGHSTLTLGGNTDVALIRIDSGVHVDMSAGSLHFSGAENEVMEVHVAEALLRPESNQPTQALVTILAPKVLQITARHGGLNFTYRQEFQNLPEGETYRIYLDAPAEPQSAAGTGTQKAGNARKVAYYIVGAGLGGVAAWGIHEAVASGNAPISPVKP
jgi:hypothetical protein